MTLFRKIIRFFLKSSFFSDDFFCIFRFCKGRSV